MRFLILHYASIIYEVSNFLTEIDRFMQVKKVFKSIFSWYGYVKDKKLSFASLCTFSGTDVGGGEQTTSVFLGKLFILTNIFLYF